MSNVLHYINNTPPPPKKTPHLCLGIHNMKWINNNNVMDVDLQDCFDTWKMKYLQIRATSNAMVR